MPIKNIDALLSSFSGELHDARRDALEILAEAVEGSDAYRVTLSAVHVDDGILHAGDKKFELDDFGNIYVIGFGKAGTGMARAVGEILPVKRGAVIAPGGGAEAGRGDMVSGTIKVFYGSHPLPSEENLAATDRLLDIVKGARKNDLVIVLISGGGSALLCKPRISLEGMTEITDRLMRAGCTIEELNTVRKHLSYVKGGRLALESRAHMLSLIISDVMGNPVEFIASGPTSPDTTTYRDAARVLEKYGLRGAVREVDDAIDAGIEGRTDETPEHLDNVTNVIIADNGTACRAAAEAASGRGYHQKIVSTSVSGEARDAGRDIARYSKLFPRDRAVLIFGGETTVTVTGGGEGGRNQELVLGAIREIEDERIVIVSCGTDGIDGNSDAAGAVGDGTSIRRAEAAGMDAESYLENNDSYHFFKKLNDLIITGRTGTNVMDIQIIIKY